MSTSSEPVGFGDTTITGIDGVRGILTYRGYRIEDVVRHFGYGATAALLLGDPQSAGIAPDDIEGALRSRRELSPDLERIMDAIAPETPVVDGFRTAISAMDDVARVSPPTMEECLDVIARSPTIGARLYRRSVGAPVLPANPTLGQVGNYLWLVLGAVPTPPQARALERYFVLMADHGISASTLTLRVVLSTRSDLASAVSAALGALKGPLHGGAPPEVLEMLDGVGSIDRVDAWIDRTLDRGDRLFGFGHPTYRVEDPRATLLREFAREVATPERYALARRFEEAALPRLAQRRPEQPLFTNVDFYGAILLEGVGVPRVLFTPTFAIARMAGWSAHAMEQVSQNRLVRPAERYRGPPPKAWDLGP